MTYLFDSALTETDFSDKSYAIYSYNNNDPLRYAQPETSVGYYSIELMVNFFLHAYMDDENDTEALYIPRINMIGHSGGGILNMEYAIEHPNIVDSLYSIGTPYNGSKIANALSNMGHPIYSSFWINLLYDFLDEDDDPSEVPDTGDNQSLFNCDAIKDCIDADFYLGLKYFWNQYQNSDSLYHTKLYAIGTSTSYQYFLDLANSFSNEIPNIMKNNYNDFIDLMSYLNHDVVYKDYLQKNTRYEDDSIVEKQYFKDRYYDYSLESIVSLTDVTSSWIEIRAYKFALLGLYNSMVYDNVIMKIWIGKQLM